MKLSCILVHLWPGDTWDSGDLESSWASRTQISYYNLSDNKEKDGSLDMHHQKSSVESRN